MASRFEAAKKEKQLIVMSLPDDSYYRKSFQDIEYFVCLMGEKCEGIDDFLVVYSSALEKRYRKCSAPPFGRNAKRLIVDESIDLWTRDFGPVLPKRQVKFSYRPKYLKAKDAKFVESEFMKVLGKLDVCIQQSDIVLDGGNIVDNNKNKCILSERVLAENKGKSLEVLRCELENLLLAKVAFIPDPEDTTGHADGVVAFVEDDVLLIGDYGDDEYYKAVEASVTSAFPEVETFRLPCGNEKDSSGDKKWRGFTTALGSYVNMLVTNNAIYVPQFNQPVNDMEAIDIVKTHTSKTVVPIDVSKLSHMGGSIRCMSWQMESSHSIAHALYRNCIQ